MKLLLPSIEPILQYWRQSVAIKHLNPNGVLVDMGCDNPPKMINRIRHKMIKCVGIDSVVEDKKYGNVKIKRAILTRKIPLRNQLADNITFLAVLEHMKHPQEMINEAYRVLKPSGVLIITVPAPKSRPILERMAQVGLVRKEMIDQHENYFSLSDLKKLSFAAGFTKVSVSNFQLGFNTLVVCKKD